ncbi:MAG: 2-dehydropantoate 2-reductase, partial [Candidatus Omnitrophica bacterium]|nr:2-dehydropantoate 2-reductase [Candidatus Omnitrophota bacterium]
MKIAVIGAGAIGGLVAGYLKFKEADVSLVSRAQARDIIKQKGIKISGARGNISVKIDVSDRLDYRPDLAILAVKTQDVIKAIRDNSEFLKDAAILTVQNGVQADHIVARYIHKENIISSIIMFGSTSLSPGEINHNFEGDWIIGNLFSKNNKKVLEIRKVLESVFPIHVAENIQGMKYLKIFVNSSNCFPAILGISMQEAFRNLNISRISISAWKEGLNVINSAGVKLESLPDFSLDRLARLTALPTDEGAKIFSGIMVNLSREPLYGSILQSIKRGRPSEIDYINGEFIRLARRNGTPVNLNVKLVEMVHQVEKSGKFFTKAEL